MKILRGIPASPGIAIGKAFLFKEGEIPYERKTLLQEEVPLELERFKKAVENVAKDLKEIREDVVKKLGESHARLIDAHNLILKDESFFEKTIEKIKKERRGAEEVFHENVQKVLDAFSSMKESPMKERSQDIRDVSRRVLSFLTQSKTRRAKGIDQEGIVVAENLFPTHTARLSLEKTMGFACDFGGKTSHTSILARAIGIPAVVGLETVLENTRNGSFLIVDGRSGIVVVNPDESTLRRYEKEKKRYKEFQKDLLELKDLPATTLDGRTIDLSVNIDYPEEVKEAKKRGAEGVGIFRTEYLFQGDQPPDEKRQIKTYGSVIRQFSGSVILRTFDLRGDKLPHPHDRFVEENPILGLQSIRYSLIEKEVFKTQLRAILQTSTLGNVKLMFPMISTLEELLQAKEILKEVKKELHSEGIPFDEEMETGMMIEVPSAALNAAHFAREVSFFSIGTNDLTQYTLAVDRTNDRVAYLYDHLHPTVLALIQKVIEEGHARHIWVGVCGEMAGDLLAVPILLGLGIDELSTEPLSLLGVKQIIRGLSMEEAKRMAHEVLKFSTAGEVRRYMREEVGKRFPDLVEVLVEPQE
ncbi:phosphoenolpyruvate--protein phosphotransferase [candidate division TA06 bacterium]|nr:phosphoenolpyruvate--protein phosphotransferase [candidate division TA06 bacterium]